jgi:hypothetical protein
LKPYLDIGDKLKPFVTRFTPEVAAGLPAPPDRPGRVATNRCGRRSAAVLLVGSRRATVHDELAFHRRCAGSLDLKWNGK